MSGSLTTCFLRAATLALALGCSPSTGSERFSFHAVAGGNPEFSGTPLTFQNESGWNITLSEARVTLGPIYLNSQAGLRDESASILNFLVKPAHAQGASHLESGRVVGEVLAQVTFDALSSNLVEFPSLGSMVSEPVRTAEVWFYPADGSAQVPVALRVRGRAERAARSVAFRGDLLLNEDWVANGNQGARGAQALADLRKVRGIATVFQPSVGGSLALRFDVRRLFRGANFDSLEQNPSDADGTKRLNQSKDANLPQDQVMVNLYQGLRLSSGTYTFSWLE